MTRPADLREDVRQDDEERTRFAHEVGQVLRDIRRSRGLSLRQVTIRSGGRFKPSSVASYERGERHVSLERLFALIEVYEVDLTKVVGAIASRLGRGSQVRGPLPEGGAGIAGRPAVAERRAFPVQVREPEAE